MIRKACAASQQDGSIAGNAFVVVPLHRKARRIARHHRKLRSMVVVAKDLLEPELGVEGQCSAHVSHHEHGLDSIELIHTGMKFSQSWAFSSSILPMCSRSWV